MSNAGKLVKGMLKAKKESVMGKLGDSPYEDPMEPWSSKYGAPVKNEEVVTEGDKKPYPKTWHDVDPKLGKQVDKMSQAEKVKKGLAHPDTLKKKGVAEGSGPKEKQKTPYRDINSPEYRAAADKQKQRMDKDKAAEPGKKMLSKQGVAEEVLNEDSLLMKYIRSLGFNPEFMTFAQRSSYARSNSFKRFKTGHTFDKEKQNLKKEDVELDEGKEDKIKQLKQDHATAVHWSKNERSPQKREAARQKAEKIKQHLVTQYKQSVTEETEQIDEAGTGLLMSFIKSKGLNPLTMDGNQKKAYSRSSEFRIFKMRHVKETSGMGARGDDWNEEKKQVKEAVDEKDTVTMDIPLLIRVLEFIREDVKTDMDLHRVVENLIDLRTEGVLTMDHYDMAVKIKSMKEEVENLEELSSDLLGRYKTAAGAQASAADKAGDYAKGNKRFSGIMKATKKQFDNDAKKVNELKKQDDNMELDDRITREEKKMKGADPCWKGYQMVGTKKKGGRSVPNCVPEQVQEGIGGIEDSPMSATNSVKAMESEHRKKNMKSARIIKSIYKKKGKNESMYDWEKTDKGGKVSTAKITLQGGTTMTGKPRDTVEIEPVLKTRPNSQNNK